MIEIVDYDPSWPERFATEAARVHAAFGNLARRVEHVGSTSVPGLAAKPVIDMQISVPTLSPLAAYESRLASLGYRHFPVGDFDLVYPFFHKPATWPSTFHVHLCIAGGGQERRHLAFRDYLRRHPAVAADYAQLKRQLAAVHDGATFESRERYSLAKTGFVTSVLERALPAPYPDPDAP